MLTYCLKYKKNTENVNSKKKGKTMLLSKCALRDGKKSRLMKEQEIRGILSSLALKTPLSKIPLFCKILFWIQFFHWIVIISV